MQEQLAQLQEQLAAQREVAEEQTRLKEAAEARERNLRDQLGQAQQASDMMLCPEHPEDKLSSVKIDTEITRFNASEIKVRTWFGARGSRVARESVLVVMAALTSRHAAGCQDDLQGAAVLE